MSENPFQMITKNPKREINKSALLTMLPSKRLGVGLSVAFLSGQILTHSINTNPYHDL